MNQKGQVTLYVMVGIVILVIVGLLVFFKGSLLNIITPREDVIKNVEVQQVVSLAKECMTSSFEDSLILVGKLGGTIVPQSNSYLYRNIPLKINYNLGESKVSSLDVISQEIEEYVKKESADCLKESKQNVELSVNNVVIDFNQDTTDTVINYQVKGSVGEIVFDHKDEVGISLPVRFSYLHNAVLEIVTATIEDPANIDVDLVLSYGLNVTIENPEETVLIYILRDNQSLVRGGGYEYVFANLFEN